MEEDLKNIKEFLSKKTLDEVDKFLFDKYIKSMERVLEKYNQNEKIIDLMAKALIGKSIYDENKENAIIYFKENKIKELFRKKVENNE